MVANLAPIALEIHPLTPDRWTDLETLFGPRGAYGGCWRMWWRRSPAVFKRDKGAANRAAFQALVATEATPSGLLAYAATAPIGWCALAPREEYPRLERSRAMARVDGAPVWSITCFFVSHRYRRQGVTTRLLTTAVAHAASWGVRIVEGYPIDPCSPTLPDAFA
ncbi:MAG TPA: GNAT family N-acetyltransferase [Chloroflexota bacterium]|nr:GNAT family N-acetyltransferase [Chloroflexota bacterium]